MKLTKAHAFGNDFLLVDARAISPDRDRSSLARALCERHSGIGADGLVIYERSSSGATMRLLNADGSRSEVSGNGVRCLAAWIASNTRLKPDTAVDIETEAGTKRLNLLDREGRRFTFRAAMGHPEHVERCRLAVGDGSVEAITMRVGNPQCVVLGNLGDVTEERLRTIAAALSVHSHFPEGTNVELAAVEAPNRVRILIWERGVGPTLASGTGACAAAVAAIRYAGAPPNVFIVSPGGTQRVEWQTDGLYLTGWAELVAEIVWRGDD